MSVNVLINVYFVLDVLKLDYVAAFHLEFHKGILQSAGLDV
jgi:hypothetical protein